MSALVLSTRPAGQRDPLVAALLRADYRVAAVPTVATGPVEAGGALDRAVATLGPADWVVVTSATGARAALDAIRRTASDAGSFRWAAVGRSTAAVLELAGVVVDVVPGRADARSLGTSLAATEPLAGRAVLLARADLAGRDLPEGLRAVGARVIDAVAYLTIEGPAGSREPLAAALADPDLGAVVFASGSAVRGALTLAAGSGRARLAVVPLVSIGPATSRVIREHGLRVAAEAPTPSVEGLVSAVASAVPAPVSPASESRA